MKIKQLLLTAMCSLSLGAFAQTGTLLFYESFSSSSGSAETETYTTDCKIGGKFYELAPSAIGGDSFNHGGRWDYPNKSDGNIWKPTSANSFRFKLNTSKFSYAYFSLASLYWGNYNVSYSFDGKNWEDFDRGTLVRLIEPAPDNYCDGNYCLRNFWYDQYTENLGGKDAVYILIEYLSGNPLELDDLQVIGYKNENDLTEMLSPLTKKALGAVIPHANEYYAKCEANDKGIYCPSKIEKFESAIALATAVNAKATVPFTELYETFATLHNTFLSLGSGRDKEPYNPDDDSDYDPAKDPEDYAKKLEVYQKYAKMMDDFIKASNNGKTLIKDIEAGKYTKPLSAEAIQKLKDLNLEITEIDADFCHHAYMTDLTTQITATLAELQQQISVEGATEEALAIYPNPANDVIRIAGAAGGNVFIFNAAGQQVLSVANYQGGAISVGSLAPGTYNAVYGRQSVLFIKK